MAAPVLPFQNWTQDECEFLMEILGNSMVKNTNLARLLAPRGFARIKAGSVISRLGYFREAKTACQEQLVIFINEETLKLVRMTIKERARRVLKCRYRFEAFLVEIACFFEIHVGYEECVSCLSLSLSPRQGRRKGLLGVLDWMLCFIIREMVCSSRSFANRILMGGHPREIFDLHLNEQLEVGQWLHEKDLVGRGVGSIMRRRRNSISFVLRRKWHYWAEVTHLFQHL